MELYNHKNGYVEGDAAKNIAVSDFLSQNPPL